MTQIEAMKRDLDYIDLLLSKNEHIYVDVEIAMCLQEAHNKIIEALVILEREE